MASNSTINKNDWQSSRWQQSSSITLEDALDERSLPQWQSESRTARFVSSTSSLPTAFDTGLERGCSTMSLPDSFDSDDGGRIGPYDVLCGRDKHSFRNVGNRRFRVTVALNMARYLEAENKSEKSRVIVSVIENVRVNGGRFLKWSSKRGEWVELDEKHTREKVGHALRDTAVAKMGQSPVGTTHAAAANSSALRNVLKKSQSAAGSATAGVAPYESSSLTLRIPPESYTGDDMAELGAPTVDPARRPQMIRDPHRASSRLSLQLSPAEIREIFALTEVGRDGESGTYRLCRGSFASVRSSLSVTRSNHSRLQSFDGDNFTLSVDEIEQLLAAD